MMSVSQRIIWHLLFLRAGRHEMEAELLIGVRTEVQLVMRKHGLTLLKSLCPLAILAAIFGLIAVVPAQADNLAYNDPSISQSNSQAWTDRKSTRLNSSHLGISYAVFCLKK